MAERKEERKKKEQESAEAISGLKISSTFKVLQLILMDSLQMSGPYI